MTAKVDDMFLSCQCVVALSLGAMANRPPAHEIGAESVNFDFVNSEKRGKDAAVTGDRCRRFLFSACRLIVDGAMGAVVAGRTVCLCLASIFSAPCAGGNDPPADEGEAHETVTAQMSTRYWSLNARLVLWCVPLCRERSRNKQYVPRGCRMVR